MEDSDNIPRYILIFGSTGMLGRYVYRYLKTVYENSSTCVIGITRKDYDVESCNVESLLKLFKQYGSNDTTIVFNAIGLIPQQNPKDIRLYYIINTIFPMMLNDICNTLKCKLIHSTTDCVYSGKSRNVVFDSNRGSHCEFSIKDGVTHYGISKRMGENINATVIRTSIIGENINGISLLEWVRSNKNNTIDGYNNHYWNGITCLQYAKIIHFMIQHNKLWLGIRHIFSPEIVSKYRLIKLISSVYNIDLTVNEIESETYCDRSLTSVYDDLVYIPPIDIQLEEMKNSTIKP